MKKKVKYGAIGADKAHKIADNLNKQNADQKENKAKEITGKVISPRKK